MLSKKPLLESTGFFVVVGSFCCFLILTSFSGTTAGFLAVWGAVVRSLASFYYCEVERATATYFFKYRI